MLLRFIKFYVLKWNVHCLKLIHQSMKQLCAIICPLAYCGIKRKSVEKRSWDDLFKRENSKMLHLRRLLRAFLTEH
jgi:hypothetical protein